MIELIKKTTIIMAALLTCPLVFANTKSTSILVSDLSLEKLPSVEHIYPEKQNKLPDAPDPAGSELTQMGQNVQGVYLPYPKLRSWKAHKIVRWVKEIGANAIVLDIKDDRGRVTFSKTLPLAKNSPHGEVKRMAALVQKLKDNNIYVIGRLVCFKDNQLARLKPQTAIRDKRTGAKWKDRGGLYWLDPHSKIAHEHIVSVAEAAQKLGFDEIQLDYVRFPVEPFARYARFPNRTQPQERYMPLAQLLSKVDAALELPISIDVFGLTAYHAGDRDGLGQSLEHLAPYIDAISPMVYLANWPKKYWENPSPRKTHKLINGAVKAIRRRLGDKIAVRPLLQAFKWRANNFGLSFIANQINAAQQGGSSGHLFWNINGNYQKVKVIWKKQKKQAAKYIKN